MAQGGSQRGPAVAGKKNRSVFQIKVTLREIHPPIWRRVQVRDDATLAQLHRVLQIIMGWEDCHLHEFVIDERCFSVPHEDDELNERKVVDERRVRLLPPRWVHSSNPKGWSGVEILSADLTVSNIKPVFNSRK